MKLELNDIHTMIGWAAEKNLSLLEYQDADMKIRIGGPGMIIPADDRAPGGDGQPQHDRMMGENRGDGWPQHDRTMGENGGDGQPQHDGRMEENGAVGGNAVSDSDGAAQSDLPAHVIESPLVGTFFVAPSEDGEPYVRAGDTVKCGQVVGIVEAMKLMNEIEADCDGVVEEILVQNEQMVEYGQPLMKIRAKTMPD